MNNNKLRELARQAGFQVDSDGRLSLYGGCKLLLRPNYQGTVADGIKILVDLAIQEERKVWEDLQKPQRQWVMPTRNELLEIVNEFYKQNASEREIAFARLVIAKFKEKNT